MPGMWWLGGHLGAAVSALVDGQLDDDSAERAWAHVAGCASCRRLVEREGWVKRRLAEMAGAAPSTPQPPSALLGSLYELEPVDAERDREAARAAWAAVEQLEHRHRPRRRAGLAVAGVGSVSAAVLGLSTLGAAPLGIGGAPAQAPSTLSRPAGGSTATVPSTPAPGRAPASATPSAGPGATATGATSTATAPGAPTSGPFSGWRLGARTDVADAAVPAWWSR